MSPAPPGARDSRGPAARDGRAARTERPRRPTGRERRAEARLLAERARIDDDGPRTLPTSVLVAGAAAVVAILLGVALATGFLAPPSGSPDTRAATVRTLVRAQAADVAVADGRGWVLDDDAGTIRPFDLGGGGFTGPARAAGKRPVALCAGSGRLWVADAVGDAVVVVDPATGRSVGQPISVGSEPVSIAAGEGGIWVASLGSGTVSLIDPRSRSVTASVALPDGAVRVAVGDGAVWVSGQQDTLTKITPKPVGVSLRWRALRVGKGPIGVAVTPGAVWVGNAQSGTVSRVDPEKLVVTGTLHLGGDPDVLGFEDGRLWVADGQAATLSAFDASTGTRRGSPVHLAGVPRHLDSAGGALYATTANPGTVVEVQPS